MKIFAIQCSMYSAESDGEGGYIRSYAGTAVDNDHLYLTREAAEAAIIRLTTPPPPEPKSEPSVKPDDWDEEAWGEWVGDEEDSSYDDDDYSTDYTIVELEVKE